MKNVMQTILVVLMALTLANCADDGGGGGGGGGSANTARSPNRDECRYDVRRGDYRDRDGDRCDHRRYHNDDACYNYYFQPHTRYTRGHKNYGGSRWEDENGFFVDRDGDFINCDLDYVDFQNYLPYYYANGTTGRWSSGCSYWGTGLIAVPMGYGGYVCVYYQQTYSYPVYYPQTWYPYGNYSGGNFEPNWGNFARGVVGGAAALLLLDAIY
ncbi:MAG: hypothetical protein AAF202_02645 [Pseudomonadota bacterium]